MAGDSENSCSSTYTDSIIVADDTPESYAESYAEIEYEVTMDPAEASNAQNHFVEVSQPDDVPRMGETIAEFLENYVSVDENGGSGGCISSGIEFDEIDINLNSQMEQFGNVTMSTDMQEFLQYLDNIN